MSLSPETNFLRETTSFSGPKWFPFCISCHVLSWYSVKFDWSGFRIVALGGLQTWLAFGGNRIFGLAGRLPCQSGRVFAKICVLATSSQWYFSEPVSPGWIFFFRSAVIIFVSVFTGSLSYAGLAFNRVSVGPQPYGELTPDTSELFTSHLLRKRKEKKRKPPTES